MFNLPMGTGLGVGVTANDEADALEQTRSLLFRVHPFPASFEIKEVKHLDDLDQNHVRSNMENHLKRGVWYPPGFSYE